MSLEATLSTAENTGQLLASSHENILALLAASPNPVYRASIEELANSGQWEELNDRFYQALKFGTGGLRGRTVGKVVTTAERGDAAADQRVPAARGQVHPRCRGTVAAGHEHALRDRRRLCRPQAAECLALRPRQSRKRRPDSADHHADQPVI